MKLRKKDLQKLNIFAYFLSRYLNTMENKNSFYYANKYQKELAENISKFNTVKEAQEYYNDLDEEDKQQIKDMVNAKDISFQASRDKQHFEYDFNRECHTIKDQRQCDFTLEPLKCEKCGYIGEVSRNQHTLDFSCEYCGEIYK